MELSARLTAVAKMVTKGNRVCDVGCDHGYISIYLVKNNISPYVYAMDVNEGPLERAREHIRDYQLSDKIETILSDGIGGLLDREADTLLCAGMGGKLTIKIISDGIERVRQMKELILQPQSEIHLVREFVRRQGFFIDREDMIFEDGKYYPIMHIVIHSEKCNEENAVFDSFGPCLLQERNPVLKRYLEYQKVSFNEILDKLNAEDTTEKIRARKQELELKVSEIEEALKYFD